MNRLLDVALGYFLFANVSQRFAKKVKKPYNKPVNCKLLPGMGFFPKFVWNKMHKCKAVIYILTFI